MRSQFEKLIELFPKTLIPEVYNLFGKEVTDKLLTVFAGTTIRVPSTRDQSNAIRDILIYETLCAAGSSSESRQLAQDMSKKCKMSRRHVRKIFKVMQKLRKTNKKLQDQDTAVGLHQIQSISLERKSKLRVM